MIKHFEIAHYRSCDDTKFDLQPDLSVLIGPNGVGKTNVLTAMLLLRSLAQEQPLLRRNEEGVDECRIKATFDIGDIPVRLTADLRVVTNEHNADAIFGSHYRWTGLDESNPRRSSEVPMWYAYSTRTSGTHSGSAGFRHYAIPQFVRRSLLKQNIPEHQLVNVSKIGAALSSIKYYSASQFTSPTSCPVSFEVEQDAAIRRGLDLRGHRRFLNDLHSAYKTPAFSRFMSLVGPEGINLLDNIKFEEIKTSSIDYTVKSGGRIQKRTREKLLVVPQFFIGKNCLSPNQLSEGTFKAVTLLFYLTTEESEMLLIEEPEVCVHQGLLTSIMELIKTHSKRKQIVISTHSDFVLDLVEPRNVFKVSKSAKLGTKVTSLTKSMPARSLTALKSYLKTEGNLGEYWRDGGFD